MFCKIVLCCDSPYCVPCTFNDIFISFSMQTYKDLYVTDGVLNRNEYHCCQKAKQDSTSINPLPVLACQFFKINCFHTSKTPFFRTVDLILNVMHDIIIIVMNTDKKMHFYLKFTKT